MKRLELGEDRILAEAVDHQRPVAALAHTLELSPLLDRAVLVEDPPLHLHSAAARGRPLLVARAPGARRLRRVAGASCLSHERPPGEVSDWFRAASGKLPRGGGRMI